MAKKKLKIIKTLNKIAEDIDNISLNNPDAWRAVKTELADGLKSVSKKNKDVKTLLELVCQGFEAMGAQKAKEPLALAGAIWQALSTAELALVADSDSSESIEDAERNLSEILKSVDQTDADDSTEVPPNKFVPVIESLNDAAAFLVQIDPDNPDDRGRQAGRRSADSGRLRSLQRGALPSAFPAHRALCHRPVKHAPPS